MKRNSRYFLLVFFLLLSFLLHAQDKKQFEYFYHKADSLIYINTDSSEYYFKRAIAIAEKTNDNHSKIVALIDFGTLYNEKGNLTEAEKIFYRCIDLSIENNDTTLLLNSYGNLSNTYQLNGDFDKSVKYMNKTIDLLKKNGKKHGLGIAYGMMGNLYLRVNKYREALKFYDYADKIFTEFNDSGNIALTKLNKGVIRYRLQEYNAAIKNIETATGIFRRINDKLNQAKALQILSDISLVSTNYKKAIDYQQQALSIFYFLKAENDIDIALTDISDIYLEQENFQSALDSLMKAYKIAQKTKNLYHLEIITGKLKICNDSLHNYKEALRFANEFLNYHDSIFNQETSKKLSEFEIKFKVEQQKHQIDNLNAQKERIRILFTGISIIFVLSILILILLLNRQRIKNRAKTVELQQKILQIQMNPHFIFNALNAIQNYLYKAAIQESADFLSKFAQLMRTTLVNSKKKYVSIQDEIDNLTLYLNFQKLRFKNKFDYKIDIDSAIDSEITAIPPMLMQPFVENAIEHGFANIKEHGLLLIKLSKTEKMLTIIIEDNGIGINNILKNKADSKHRSLAIEITTERLKILSPKIKKSPIKIIDLSSENKHGTRITLVVPYIELF